MPRVGNRYLISASWYAARKDARRFLRLKKYLRRFTLKRVARDNDPGSPRRYFEATIPGPGAT